MKLKDIIETTAHLINEDEISNYINGGIQSLSDEGTKKLNKLCDLANLVITELSLSYVPMKKTQSVSTNVGEISFSSLSYVPTKIIELINQQNQKVDFKVQSTKILTENGTYQITYQYYPPKYQLNDDLGYSDNEVKACILAKGVCAEYLITEARFDECVMWRKRYVEEIERLFLPKSRKLNKRSFV